jgi:hypothetical protein
VVYRSSRPLRYLSALYKATTTVDRGPAGTTTVRVGDTARLDLRGTLDDVSTTIWDISSDDRFVRQDVAPPAAPDRVALFVDPGEGADPDTVSARLTELAAVLPDHVPLTVRATVVVHHPREPDQHGDQDGDQDGDHDH